LLTAFFDRCFPHFCKGKQGSSLDVFAKRLRERAHHLGLTDAEVARRAGLSERRYGHYVRGNREPDFATLMRISAAMDVTPNGLLLAEKTARLPAQDRWLARLLAAGRSLGSDDIKLAVKQVEAIAECRNLKR
jgi:transcriptional regulator with XRE-family HTH domain